MLKVIYHLSGILCLRNLDILLLPFDCSPDVMLSGSLWCFSVGRKCLVCWLTDACVAAPQTGLALHTSRR